MSSLKRLAFDLESDGLLPELTKIHCLAVRNIDTDEAKFLTEATSSTH